MEHPHGIEPYVTFLKEEGEEHRVESDQGEGGYTYKVCFQSQQPTGSQTRVEVRDQQIREIQRATSDHETSIEAVKFFPQC